MIRASGAERGAVHRGLWQGLCILWCAAGIILPIIYAEGLRRTFFPILAVTPQVPHTALPQCSCIGCQIPGHLCTAVRNQCACDHSARVPCPECRNMVVLAGQAEQSAA